MLGEIGLTIVTVGEAQAMRMGTQTATRTVVANTVEEAAVNPKIYAQLERQLSENGAAFH